MRVLLVFGTGGLLLGCVYVAFTRYPPRFEGSKGLLKYPVGRRWTLGGLVVILLFAVSSVGYYFYIHAQPPAEVVILVADFDGPEPQKYRVTETILSRLREAHSRYDDVRIIALGRPIKENEPDPETKKTGSASARAAGEQHNAAIVIWGWYGLTSEAVPLSVHFELLRPPHHMPELRPAVKGMVQVMALAGLDSFSLQMRLSEDMAFLSLFTVGMTHYAAHDWNGVIARISDALNQRERVGKIGQAEAYFYRANAYSYNSNYDRAITDFSSSIQLNPDNAGVYNNRGIAYEGKKDYDRAIADFNRSIQLNPKYVIAYNNRGVTYCGKRDYNRAIADFSRCIQLKPNSAGVYYNRGNAYARKMDYDRAIADFNRCIKLKPNDDGAYNDRGASYANKGDYDRAIADFSRAIELNPDDADAYNNRGAAYAGKNDYDRAIADYSRAVEHNPDYAGAYNNRGAAYAGKNDYGRAIADYNRAIELNPNFASAYYNRGIAYDRKRDYDRAIADYSLAIKLKPDHAGAYYNRGLSYRQKKRNEKAFSDFKKVLQLSRNASLRQLAKEQLKTL